MRRLSVFLLLVFLPLACKRATAEPKAVRVAVIGGMVMTGMWEKLSEQFEKDTGLKLEVAVCGNKEVIGPAFREGMADVLTMHSSDLATELVASGYARNLRPWARNELVILEADPAKFPSARSGGARIMSDYLTGPRGQQFLRNYAGSQPDGVPLFFPLTTTP